MFEEKDVLTRGQEVDGGPRSRTMLAGIQLCDLCKSIPLPLTRWAWPPQ